MTLAIKDIVDIYNIEGIDTEYISQSSHGLNNGQGIYRDSSDGKWKIADISIEKGVATYIVVEKISADAFVMAHSGIWQIDLSATSGQVLGTTLIANNTYYASVGETIANSDSGLAWSNPLYEVVSVVSEVATVILRTTQRPNENIVVPIGSGLVHYGATLPNNFAWCDGSELDKKDYKSLYDILGTVHGDGDGTAITSVDYTTDTFTLNSHGLSDGDIVTKSSTTSLPSPLLVDTDYYIVSSTTNTYKVSDSEGGSPINLTDNGSGTHSFHSGFKLPDERGRVSVGKDNMGGTSANRVTDSEADSLGGSMGAEDHTLSTSEIPSHYHTFANSGGVVVWFGSGINQAGTTSGSKQGGTYYSTVSAGSGNAHNNMQPTLFVNKIIRVR